MSGPAECDGPAPGVYVGHRAPDGCTTVVRRTGAPASTPVTAMVFALSSRPARTSPAPAPPSPSDRRPRLAVQLHRVGRRGSLRHAQRGRAHRHPAGVVVLDDQPERRGGQASSITVSVVIPFVAPSVITMVMLKSSIERYHRRTEGARARPAPPSPSPARRLSAGGGAAPSVNAPGAWAAWSDPFPCSRVDPTVEIVCRR